MPSKGLPARLSPHKKRTPDGDLNRPFVLGLYGHEQAVHIVNTCGRCRLNCGAGSERREQHFAVDLRNRVSA